MHRRIRHHRQVSSLSNPSGNSKTSTKVVKFAKILPEYVTTTTNTSDAQNLWHSANAWSKDVRAETSIMKGANPIDKIPHTTSSDLKLSQLFALIKKKRHPRKIWEGFISVKNRINPSLWLRRLKRTPEGSISQWWALKVSTKVGF